MEPKVRSESSSRTKERRRSRSTGECVSPVSVRRSPVSVRPSPVSARRSPVSVRPQADAGRSDADPDST